jgi:hypothetical protein
MDSSFSSYYLQEPSAKQVDSTSRRKRTLGMLLKDDQVFVRVILFFLKFCFYTHGLSLTGKKAYPIRKYVYQSMFVQPDFQLSVHKRSH